MAQKINSKLSKASDVAHKAIVAHQHLAGPLLPILHSIQAELRCVPDNVVAPIAEALNLSRAEVHGVISFYHSFTSKPLGQHVIEVCRAESCQAVGGRTIEQHFKTTLGIDFGETTQDGKISLEPVFCLGNCGCSPAVRVGKNMFGRMSVAKVDDLVGGLQNGSASKIAENHS